MRTAPQKRDSSAVVYVRMTPEQKCNLEKLAKRQGLPLSTWLRNLGMIELRKLAS